MFDHLSLGVRDLDAAREFYDAFFAPLGAAVSSATPKEVAYGPGGQAGLFYLYPVEGAQVAGLGAHLAFTADSHAAVDAAYESAMERGATAIRVAGPHPDIAPAYYGCVILDPDGNKLEIVAGTMH
ncbi:MAG: VOC family protein [Alphaproteobacteria bacterium]|nr:VOC family protein [Alphaproteobacteria bacterium]MBU1513994.1 VOC family protein [Alphaproteobacteria bacterium]MBU2093066.1 VOC family protein [Alphaproteobacteria bacterium]MBU2151731.1 VOC family protein [Alphaproteobacteria bacterium]MBU2309449.1 VOC family protein [Alphaproteobacteria bacterium]